MAYGNENAKLARIIDESENIVFFGGAGISTESGIPDFRSERGMCHALDRYGHSPEALLSHSFFVRNPEMFFEYYIENLIHTSAKPNVAHLALAKLEQQGKLKAVVTQNIDGLHQLAGSKCVYELHGSVFQNYCMDCGREYALEYVLLPTRSRGIIPICEVCGGIVRPNVVLYEESLNDAVVQGAARTISSAKTLIVGGTSLVVYPAAGLLRYFAGENLILINRSETPYDKKADCVIHDSIGSVLSEVVFGK